MLHMNMRMDPDDLARVSVGLFDFDTALAAAADRTPFGTTLHTWWQRFVAPSVAPLPPPAPELCLPFADTEAIWCPR
jgi:hypothetical protein